VVDGDDDVPSLSLSTSEVDMYDLLYLMSGFGAVQFGLLGFIGHSLTDEIASFLRGPSLSISL
jgi:hypothetical protein